MSAWPEPESGVRELSDFLKAGDAKLGVGLGRYPAMKIGKGFPEARRSLEGTGVDAVGVAALAVSERRKQFAA